MGHAEQLANVDLMLPLGDPWTVVPLSAGLENPRWVHNVLYRGLPAKRKTREPSRNFCDRGLEATDQNQGK